MAVESEQERVKRAEKELRKLEKRVAAELGPLRHTRVFEPEEVGRVIKFWETYLAANSGSFRDQMIRQYVVYRLGFMYKIGG